MIRKLWPFLTNKRKKQFLALIGLMLIASFAELLSIGAILPFLGVISDPDIIYENPNIQPLIKAFGIDNSSQLLLPFTLIFIIASLFAVLVRLALLFAQTRLSYAAGADISIDIYRKTLYQEYSVHVTRNSSEVINGIITKTNTVITGVLMPSLLFLSSVFIITGVTSFLFLINPKISLLTFTIFSLLYFLISFTAKKSLQNKSEIVANKSEKMVKSLQEGLGGIRDVLIDGTQDYYVKIYKQADLALRRASGDIIFIGGSPRFLMEGLGMSLIALLAYYLVNNGEGIYSAIPTLGALAIGAQRLLPVLQQAYAAHSTIRGASISFQDIIDLLSQPLPEYQDNNEDIFKDMITFDDISFRYSNNSPWVLRNVNLSFKKGARVGIIGTTGSGKSTFIDILMGLLLPTTGRLLIDDNQITSQNRRDWQQKISHVPQSIFLADASIHENIAFGKEKDEIKEERVIKVAEKAKIRELLKKSSIESHGGVGERGVQLSGGQRQRIGIARALYKNSDVLVLDEATSALDDSTEREIMNEISKLKDNITIFIIAHRLTTLRNCDRIIRINDDFSITELKYADLDVH